VSGAGPAGGPDPRESNLGYWLSDARAEFPDRIALIDLSRPTPREVTYSELDERMDRVANLLSDNGIGIGDRFALSVGNRFEFVEIMFGAMRCGAVPVPLNFKLSAESLAHIVADADCQAAFVEPAVTERSAAVIEQLGIDRRWEVGGPGAGTGGASTGWFDYADALARASADYEPPLLGADHPAFQPYTSGSTGKPKGVVLSHEGQLWWVQCLKKYWPAGPDDRALAAVPLYHKNAMRVSVKPKLHVGASVVILPRFEPGPFLRALSEHRCTEAGGVPAMYRMMLARQDLLESLDFSSLKVLEMGSAVVGAELIAAVETAFGATVIEAYGLTEGGGPLREPVDERPAPRGSCGLAAPEVGIRLMGERGEDAEEGELWVRSPAVLVGYNNRPDLDAERIKDGWLRTGDLFRRDAEGFFYFQGRTDDQFSCGGENINPKEVELLLVQHPAVIDAVVAPVPHALKDLAPAALVTLRPDREADEAALRAFTLEHGPAYAHPRRIFAVDELPVGGTGKIDRKAVRERLLALIADDPDPAGAMR